MVRQAKQIIRRILHADDSPQKIAWGVALGMFVAATPTIGIQMIVAGALAWLLRGNKAAAVAVVWISNPWTAIPIYWFNYWFGCLLMSEPMVNLHQFEGTFGNLRLSETEGLTDYIFSIFGNLAAFFGKLAEVAWPLWTGSLAVGFFWAILSYPLVVYIVRHYREFRLRHSKQRVES